jgi:hypothetical protein
MLPVARGRIGDVAIPGAADAPRGARAAIDAPRASVDAALAGLLGEESARANAVLPTYLGVIMSRRFRETEEDARIGAPPEAFAENVPDFLRVLLRLHLRREELSVRAIALRLTNRPEI